MILSLARRYFPKRQIEVNELWMKTTTGKALYFGNLLRVSKQKSDSKD
jgi:23S rRNA (cytosine1962-C5)-methyltransferase